ncbi:MULTISPECIES: condensation domain-containing protein [Photorhabdus]|uniref:Photobactin biosynthesis protein phbg n=2 Tax=Photorhabdus asymbiotica TaxID=291112 RepID=C7BMY9_PHOAA|nr:condensation domain-containing protein [Photorhabdus asymbiotica]RKS57708.1 enterobactin synthetase component F [Photorhabdus asymbiotica]CAQ82975.1 putative photobactin biosynthesis protein phbg [Photorhabdus asymbiotica]
MLNITQTSSWMPLTQAQQYYWHEFSLHSEKVVSTVAHYLDIQGNVDQEALCKAITMMISETDVLSIRFQLLKEERFPSQQPNQATTPQLKFIDLQTQPDAFQTALQLMRADVESPLNLLTQPLSAQWLFKLSESHYLWYNRAHHILLDGFGMALIEHHCAHFYSYYLGKKTNSDTSFHSLSSYLTEEQEYCNSEQYEKDRLYWQNYLSSTLLTTMDIARADYSTKHHYASCTLSEDIATGLTRLSANIGIAWPDLLVALSSIYLLHHFSTQTQNGEYSMPLWLPYMNRRTRFRTNTPALMTNILPLLINANPNETLETFLKKTINALHTQRTHARYRIEQIFLDHNLPQDTRYLFSPLINVLPFDSPHFVNCQTKRHILTSGLYDCFSFNIIYRGKVDAGELVVDLDADSSMFGKKEVENHQKNLTDFLQKVLTGNWLSLPIKALYS